jgi:hypothetical protein
MLLDRLGVIWVQAGTTKLALVLFGRYVPMAETKSCALFYIGTVSDTFVELIEKSKSQSCVRWL